MPDPIEVLLKFGFIIVLYLFLLWVARSALRDLARGPLPGAGLEEGALGAKAGAGRFPQLVVERGGGLRSGACFELGGSATIGRSPQADIQIEDPFASSQHARVYRRNESFYIEDMESTNGTYLNGHRLNSREPLRVQDRIRIGETEFRYEE